MASENRKRILIVEDEQDIQDLAQTLLNRVNLETITAYDVATAVQVLRSKPLPDLVLLDLMLPDISGLELLRQMRAKTLFDQLPVVILSALADPDQIRQALEMGADRYLTKTTMVHNLVKTVQETLRTGRRRANQG